MKICLLRGPAVLVINSSAMRSAQPLGLAYIAASLTEAGHEVSVIDAIAEDIDAYYHFYDDLYINGLDFETVLNRINPDTDVIGISCMFSFNWLSDRHLIDLIGEKFPYMKIIAGGEHITGLPEHSIKATKHLDACVLGEGEETIVELINAYENDLNLKNIESIVFRAINGEIITTPRRTRKKDIENFPWPAWHLFPMQSYFDNKLYYGVDLTGRTLPVLATRGCPFQCTFCSSPDMWGTRYYMRPPEDMLAEMQYLIKTYKITNFDFFDLTAIIKKEWIIRFCKLLIENKLNITWQIPGGTRSETIDEEVAYYLYQSGCRNITYAPESGSKEILKIIKKKVSLPNMLKSMSYSNKNGMNIKLNMIIAFPEETHKSIFQTLWFLIKASYAGAHDMAPAVFHPYPGSALFNRLLKEGELSLEDDQYYLDLIYVNYLGKIRFFSKDISPIIMKFYVFLNYSIFYSSNYLFRPIRLFRTIRNVITAKVESRLEFVLRTLYMRKKGTFTFIENNEYKPTIKV